MKSLLQFRGLLTLLLGLGSLRAAQASHIRGGDITYASITPTTAGVPRYHIVVREFEEATVVGNPATALIQLDVSMGGCYVQGAANTMRLTVPYTTVVTSAALCASSNLHYRIVTFETDLDLPVGLWRLSTYSNARIADIQNITSSVGANMYVEASIESSLALPNTSPKFESVLQPIISTAALAQHSFSAFDADGDSLRYELIMPYANCNQTLAGFITPHFGLNAGTGAFAPLATSTSAQGYYDTALRITEYRRINGRWVSIGYVMRDQMYLLWVTPNQPPTFTTMQVNGRAAQALGPAIAVPRGQAVSVLLQASDPDVGQSITFASEAPAVVPGLSLARVGTTNGVLLTWQIPATLPPGRYAIAVGVLDNACASEERTLVFVVGNATLAARPTLNAAAEVYPTPFREQVQFKTAPNQGVVLFDALGREVARLTSAADGLVRWQPATTLPAGLYLARAAADGQPLARLLRAE